MMENNKGWRRTQYFSYEHWKPLVLAIYRCVKMYVNIFYILWYQQNWTIIYVSSQLFFSFTNLLAIQTKTVYSHYSNTIQLSIVI